MMLRTTAQAIAASAAFLVPPVAARAQTEPSDAALGVAAVQWAMLYCDGGIVRPQHLVMLQMIGPMIPESEKALAYSYMQATLETMFGKDTEASCAFLAPILANTAN